MQNAALEPSPNRPIVLTPVAGSGRDAGDGPDHDDVGGLHGRPQFELSSAMLQTLLSFLPLRPVDLAQPPSTSTRVTRVAVSALIALGFALNGLPFAFPDIVAAQTLDPQRGVLSMREAIAKVVPATVRINLGASGKSGAGTGVIIDAANGYIVTNRHVIAEPGGFRVKLHDGRTLPAVVVGADRRADLALLKVEADGLQQVEFTDAQRIEMGDMVVAIGFPFGLPLSSSLGIVSAKAEPVQGAFDETRNSIQTDAAVNPGNSGGPLIDSRGRLVGINSAIQGGADGSFAGIAFAIPSNVVAGVVVRLSNGQARIAVADPTLPALADGRATSREALKPAANSDSIAPAEPAAPDTATLLGWQFPPSEPVAAARERRKRVPSLEARAPAATAPVGADSNSAAAAEQPNNGASGPLVGLVVEDLTAKSFRRRKLETRRGAYIVGVEDGSPAKNAGLRPGDVIVGIDGAPVIGTGDLQDTLEARHGRFFTVTYLRDARRRVASVHPEIQGDSGRHAP